MTHKGQECIFSFLSYAQDAAKDSWIDTKKLHITKKKKSSNEKTDVIRWFIYPDFKNKKWIYKGNSKVEEKLIDLTNFWNNQSFFKI